MTIRGADEVARALEDEGVRFTFGIPGTHNIELYDALERSRVEPVLVTDEQSASFMADAVSRATGEVGVVNVVPGAGLTHALSGIAEAFMDNVALVVLMCGIRGDTGRAFQLHDVDQRAIVAPVTKAQLVPENAGAIYATVRHAFALARSGCPGPVAVEIPADFYLVAHGGSARPAPAPPGPPSAPSGADLDRAAALLAGARRPVLYVGRGAAGAGDALVELAEALSAPVATTIQGKGVFPESHPLWLWNGLGRSTPKFARRVFGEADAMLAIGCRFSEVATGSYGFEPPAPLIHVDIDPTVPGRNFRPELGVVADAAAFVGGLLPRLVPRDPRAGLLDAIAEGHRAVAGEQRAAGGARVSAAALFDALASHGREETIYTADSGNGTFLAMEHLRLDRPGRFLAPVDYSCMGYAVPAAVGAKIARPDADVVALAGDGALLMTGLELLTARAAGCAPLVCVLRDGELGQIAQFQRTALNRDTCSVLPGYDVRDYARFVGAEFVPLADDAATGDAVRTGLEIARGGRACVLDVAIDYSRKTWFTRGVVATNLLRLAWPDRLRMIARLVSRRLSPR